MRRKVSRSHAGGVASYVRATGLLYAFAATFCVCASSQVDVVCLVRDLSVDYVQYSSAFPFWDCVLLSCGVSFHPFPCVCFSAEGFLDLCNFPGVFMVGVTLGDGLQPRSWCAGRGLGCALLWQR